MLDLLAELPYRRGKGRLTLELLRRLPPGGTAVGKLPHGARITLGADAMRQTLLPYWIGQYEREVALTFERALAQLAPGKVVGDVGANLGYYTLIAAAARRERGTVVAAEPNPIAFAELQRNVKLNHFENVALRQEAVSHSPGTLNLYVYPESITLASLRPADAALEQKVSVRVTTLDALRDEYGALGLVKLDVEGGEADVVRGGRETLEQDRPFIIYEEFAQGAARFGSSPQELAACLYELGYTLYTIERASWTRAAFSPWLAPDPHAPTYRNILAVPPGHTWTS